MCKLIFELALDIGGKLVCEKQIGQRFWKHYSGIKVNTETECMDRCIQDLPNCHGATWDPLFKAGNTCCNCWLMMKGFTSTSQNGFTSFQCQKSKSKIHIMH